MTDYRVFPATDGPSTSVTDGQPLNLGMEIRTSGPTWLLGLAFWRGNLDVDGAVEGQAFTVDDTSSGTPVPGSHVAFALSGLGWQVGLLGTPLALSEAVRHKACVHFPDRFHLTPGYWDSGGPGELGIVHGPLTAYSHAASVAGQGSFSTGPLSNYPAISGGGANYWIDVLITDVEPTTEVRVQLAQAVEAHTAHAIAVTKRALLAQAAETGTAHAVAPAHRVPLDLAAEVDTAHQPGLHRAVPLGLAVETDTALPVSVAGALLVPGVHTTGVTVAGLTTSGRVSGLEAR